MTTIVTQYVVKSADGQSINNFHHREDGPAVIWDDGAEEWFLHGKLHRTDGPACIFPEGSKLWYVNDQRAWTNKEFQKIANITDEEMTLIILKYGNVE